MTFQFMAVSSVLVVVEVFWFFPQDRVLQRFLKQLKRWLLHRRRQWRRSPLQRSWNILKQRLLRERQASSSLHRRRKWRRTPLQRSRSILEQCLWRQRRAHSRLHRRRQRVLQRFPELRSPEVFKALSQDRVPPLVVDMIFLSLLGGDALRMRLAVCTIGMCTRARRDGRLL